MKRIFSRICSSVLAAAIAVGVMFSDADMETVSAADKVVIVIDPGHGGENLGSDYLPIAEKYYTMQVAIYMKQELEQYENVVVYLTHTDDVDMSLEERAAFAESVDADFLFSLHFNASSAHDLYGSEVWVPSEGALFSQGFSVAYEFMLQFTQEMGLFSRGIKTKLGSTGKDYYGVIRACSERNIPSVIVEHCHVDNINDVSALQSAESLQKLGVCDATAVARYFGLVKKDGSADYSSYTPIAVPVPSTRVANDTTPPEYVTAKLIDYNSVTRYATVELSAHDNESTLQYYAFSTDGGATWSAYKPWSSSEDTVTVTVNIGYGSVSSLVFKVTNLYDDATVSNALSLY